MTDNEQTGDSQQQADSSEPTGSSQQPTANSQQPTANSEKPPPAKRLDEMTILDLQKMGVDGLRRLCRKAGLSAKGKGDALIERLRPRVRRITRIYIKGVTTCAYCPADIQVSGTSKEPTEDGRVLVVRQVKCKGKHHHQYPLKELVKPDK